MGKSNTEQSVYFSPCKVRNVCSSSLITTPLSQACHFYLIQKLYLPLVEMRTCSQLSLCMEDDSTSMFLTESQADGVLCPMRLRTDSVSTESIYHVEEAISQKSQGIKHLKPKGNRTVTHCSCITKNTSKAGRSGAGL